MRVRIAVSSLIVAGALTFVTPLLANSGIPKLKTDAFGHQYDKLFKNTIVYAQVGWLQLFYRYSGDGSAQPAPGWVRLDIKSDEMSDTDRIVFRLNDHDVIQSEGGSYFAITLEQAKRVARSPQVTVLAWRDGTRGHAAGTFAEMPLSPEQRQLIGQLTDYGKDWVPPESPWEMSGPIALGVDLRPAVAPRLDQVKSLLVREIERREKTMEPFLLVCTGPEYTIRSPVVRGTAWYVPGEKWYKPGEARKFVRELTALPDERGSSLGQMAVVVKGQQLQSMVFFVSDGPPLTDPDKAENQLREESCRLFVVWLGEPGSTSERNEQLKALTLKTRGHFVALPPLEGTGAK